MIDRDARKILGKNLQGLVEGTITSDQFSCSRPISKGDRAIDGIWGFGDSLYSDIASYTLKGKYAVNNKSYDIAQRCILFLATDMEYMWPDLPNPLGLIWFLRVLFWV